MTFKKPPGDQTQRLLNLQMVGWRQLKDSLKGF